MSDSDPSTVNLYAEAESRLRFAVKILGGPDAIRGMKIADLGCGSGHMSEKLQTLSGQPVLAVEGLKSNIDIGRTRRPHINFIQRNLNLPFGDLGKFDLVVNFGLLYHLRDIETHLRSAHEIIAPGGVMVLETIVCDQMEKEILTHIDEAGNDQAIDCCGSRFSEKYLENILSKYFSWQRYRDSELNWSNGTFDFKNINNGQWQRAGSLRAFYVCRLKSDQSV